MANNHIYGIRWKRSIHGAETPTVLVYPMLSAYAPNTLDGGGGTAVNINIGDPVRLREDGTLRLTSAGVDVATEQGSGFENVYGVVVGFPRVIVGGSPRPGSFYTTTTYTGGIGSDNAPLCAIIPAEGNIFEMDFAAVQGTGLKSDYMATVGRTAPILYTPLTSGIGQPKANPLIGTLTATGGLVQTQLLIVGLGKYNDDQDYTAVNATMQIMFNSLQNALHVETGANGVYGSANA